MRPPVAAGSSHFFLTAPCRKLLRPATTPSPDLVRPPPTTHPPYLSRLSHFTPSRSSSTAPAPPSPLPPRAHPGQGAHRAALPGVLPCPAHSATVFHVYFQTVAHFADCSQSSFNVQRQRESPPILVAHTGSRCPATTAGAVTVQGVPPHSSPSLPSPLLLFLFIIPLASQASSASDLDLE